MANTLKYKPSIAKRYGLPPSSGSSERIPKTIDDTMTRRVTSDAKHSPRSEELGSYMNWYSRSWKEVVPSPDALDDRLRCRLRYRYWSTAAFLRDECRSGEHRKVWTATHSGAAHTAELQAEIWLRKLCWIFMHMHALNGLESALDLPD
eukprot:5440024-Prymnesium_polylepis.2